MLEMPAGIVLTDERVGSQPDVGHSLMSPVIVSRPRAKVSRMRVRVLFFGMLKDLVGRSDDSLDLPEGATIGDVLRHYEATVPQLKTLLPCVALSVNQVYAGSEVELRNHDEVAILPPVSGGKGGPGRVAIVREAIDTHSVLEALKNGEDGAALVFEGTVRNNTRGRKTLYLDYEAYEAMALKQMDELAEKALAQFKIRDVALIHRLGRLEIGETSVLIVVASAHRAAAFDACRWMIDTLKRTVPIWKKEYFEDGAVWADGEPFPEEIVQPKGTAAEKHASKRCSTP
jgi:MoaE-MoaD fusion protein